MLTYRFVAPLLAFALPHALYYFLPGEKQRVRGVLLENLVLLTAAGGAFSIFLAAGGHALIAQRFGNPALSRLLLILAPYPLLVFPAEALGACLVSRGRVKSVAVYNVASRVGLFCAAVLAALAWRTADAVLLAHVVVSAVLLVVCLKLMAGACREGEARITPAGLRRQLAYSVPMGLSGMLATLSKNLDKVIVAAMCSVPTFAVYSVGAMEIPLIGVLTGSVIAVLTPEITVLYKEDKRAEIVALWQRAMLKCAVVILPAMAFLLCMAGEVIHTIYSRRYGASATVFQIYLLLLPIRITNFATIFTASGRTTLLLWRAVGALAINALLTVLFVSRIGYLGACIATVVTMYGWMVPYSLVNIARILGVRGGGVLPLRGLLRVTLASVVPCAIFLVPVWRSIEADIVRLAVSAAVYGPLCLACLHALKLVDVRRMVAHAGARLGRMRKPNDD
jgi:O-antigen/teichoic acid export membrane protein